jgi:AraC family transcriptional regulator
MALVGTRQGSPACWRQAGAIFNGARHPAESMPRVVGALSPYKTQQTSVYIGAHLSRRCRTEDLARVAGLSASYFSRAFHKRFGLPVQRYVQKQRVVMAQGMLMTNAPLTEIALSCGLSDQSQLCRLFRRQVGQSPGAWRRAMRGLALHDALVSGHSLQTP